MVSSANLTLSLKDFQQRIAKGVVDYRARGQAIFNHYCDQMMEASTDPASLNNATVNAVNTDLVKKGMKLAARYAMVQLQISLYEAGLLEHLCLDVSKRSTIHMGKSRKPQFWPSRATPNSRKPRSTPLSTWSMKRRTKRPPSPPWFWIRSCSLLLQLSMPPRDVQCLPTTRESLHSPRRGRMEDHAALQIAGRTSSTAGTAVRRDTLSRMAIYNWLRISGLSTVTATLTSTP